MSVYLINRYKNDLQLGKLKVNCLLLKLNCKLITTDFAKHGIIIRNIKSGVLATV